MAFEQLKNFEKEENLSIKKEQLEQKVIEREKEESLKKEKIQEQLKKEIKQELQQKIERDGVFEKHEKEIDDLIELALKEGPRKAIKRAKEMNNPYLLDKLHDVLIEKHFQELKDKRYI